MASIDSAGGFRVEVLGPVEAWVNGSRIALGGQRPRALLAVLALMPARVVTSERLIDELWGEDPPARARESLQMHVSRLRRALTEAGGDANRLVGRAGGYLLELGPGERDVDRWEAALGRARRARAAGELETARIGIDEALGVWRGAPLGGASAHGLLDGERARREEERLAATIEGIEIDLELGRHGELVGQLEALVIAHPFKERLVALQMVALYRCGRQADALAAFHIARARFVEELGIAPGSALRELEHAILAHDPALAAPGDVATPGVEWRSALPVPPNRLIGRADEVGTLSDRLRAGSVRLLTLTGLGGVGKTRLALELARAVEADFSDGARLVSLAALQRPEDVPAETAKVCEIVAVAGELADQAVARVLARKHLLLIVDNCEHVLDASPFIAQLLARCPALTILATSREPLSLHAEECYPVSPLGVPAPEICADPAAMASVDAVALFTERARAHNPRFCLENDNAAAVAEICRRLDGLPLAIELAAARCRLLSPGELAQRLDVALGALGLGPRDAPARQRTLRAAIEWSHDLMDDREKMYFARLAVFAGGATVDAADAVTGAGIETLDQLVAKSLLSRERAQPSTRLKMLETVRAYATERLVTAADHDAVRARHYRYFLELTERHGSDKVLWGVERNEHLAWLDADIGNLHAALDWAVGVGDVKRALALCAALGPYWLTRARYSDAVAWTERVLSLPDVDAHPRLRIRTLTIKSWGLWPLGQGGEQVAALVQAEAEARTLADPLVLSEVLQMRAAQEAIGRRHDAAEAAAEEAYDLALRARDDWAIASAAYTRAMAAGTAADHRDHIDRAATLLEGARNLYQLAELLAAAAYMALRRNGERDALDFLERARPIARELDSPFLWMLLHGNMGFAALLLGNVEAAYRAFRDHLKLCRAHVMVPFASEGLAGLAAIAAIRGDLSRAARLAGAATAHRGTRPEDPLEARLCRDFFEPARKRHPHEVWDTAVAEGSSLALDAAIAIALNDARDPPEPLSRRPRPARPVR